MYTAAEMPVFHLASIASSASACARLRGKPSKIAPLAASGCDSRSSTIATVTLSGTNSPRSMYDLASLPNSVPWPRCARNRSPVATCGTPSLLLQHAGLRALAGTLRAKENQVCSLFAAIASPIFGLSIRASPLSANRAVAIYD